MFTRRENSKKIWRIKLNPYEKKLEIFHRIPTGALDYYKILLKKIIKISNLRTTFKHKTVPINTSVSPTRYNNMTFLTFPREKWVVWQKTSIKHTWTHFFSSKYCRTNAQERVSPLQIKSEPTWWPWLLFSLHVFNIRTFFKRGIQNRKYHKTKGLIVKFTFVIKFASDVMNKIEFFVSILFSSEYEHVN